MKYGEFERELINTFYGSVTLFTYFYATTLPKKLVDLHFIYGYFKRKEHAYVKLIFESSSKKDQNFKKCTPLLFIVILLVYYKQLTGLVN